MFRKANYLRRYVMSITLQCLKQQDDQTSNAVLHLLKDDDAFKKLSESEGRAIIKRDAEDETKLAAGIDIAVKKGVLSAHSGAGDAQQIKVAGKSADEVAAELLSSLPGKTGNVIVLQGLSGTGKGTTVQRLKSHLPNCVCWSNGNVFRTFTHLIHQHCEAQKKPFGADVLTPKLLQATAEKLNFKKFDDGFDILIEGEGQMSTIVNTKLKMPHIGESVPTVAEQTQGEVVKFAAEAVQLMQADGCNVILEGRKQTLNYIPTSSRFELVIDDVSLLGQRRAAQRVMAAAVNALKPDATPAEVEKAIIAVTVQI